MACLSVATSPWRHEGGSHQEAVGQQVYLLLADPGDSVSLHHVRELVKGPRPIRRVAQHLVRDHEDVVGGKFREVTANHLVKERVVSSHLIEAVEVGKLCIGNCCHWLP